MMTNRKDSLWLIALLRLTDSISVRLSGAPVSWLPYYTRNELFALSIYFCEAIETDACFDDSEFSDLDIDLLDNVIAKCYNLTPEDIESLIGESFLNEYQMAVYQSAYQSYLFQGFLN